MSELENTAEGDDSKYSVNRVMTLSLAVLGVLIVLRLIFAHYGWGVDYTEKYLIYIIFYMLNVGYIFVSQSNYVLKPGKIDKKYFDDIPKKMGTLVLYIVMLYFFGNLMPAYEYISITGTVLLSDMVIRRPEFASNNWVLRGVIFVLCLWIVGILQCILDFLKGLSKKESNS